MIRFTCPGCGYQFACAEKHAGRRAKCTQCGAPMVVPHGTPPDDCAIAERDSSVAVATLAAKRERAAAIVAAMSSQRVEIPPTIAEPAARGTTPSTSAGPMGSAGLFGAISGGLALVALAMIFLLPVAVYPVAALGMLVAAVGIVAVRRREGTGKSLVIAGGVLCCVVSIGFGMLTALLKNIEQQDAVLRAEVAKAASPTPPEADPLEAAELAIPKTPPPTAAIEALQATAAFAEPKRLGEVEVRIVSVHFDVAPTKTVAEMRVDRSGTFDYSLKKLREEQQYLVLRLCVRNTSAANDLEYNSWGGEQSALFGVNATLHDERGQRYARVDAPKEDPYVEHIAADFISPGEEIIDAIVFEKPRPGVTKVTVELLGKAVSQAGSLSIDIPVAQIVSVDEFGVPVRLDEAKRPAVPFAENDDRM
ncbi:MAG: hypothetical protein KF708_01975 [Pirellulales bacterium]|nr:hypothetical protein [Pirellulales bacterium]